MKTKKANKPAAAKKQSGSPQDTNDALWGIAAALDRIANAIEDKQAEPKRSLEALESAAAAEEHDGPS